MHLSPTTTRKLQHLFYSYVYCSRARACIDIHALYKYNALSFTLGCLFLLLSFILFPFIYVCFVFTLCQCVFPARAKNWPRNKIPINVKTNVLLMYVMKRNFFFLFQLFLPLTIISFRIQCIYWWI